MAKVQIIRNRKGESKWQFLAHGATYERAKALEIKADYESRGDRIRLLPTFKESI